MYAPAWELIQRCRRFHLHLLITATIAALSIIMLSGCSILFRQVSTSSGKNADTQSPVTPTQPRTLGEKLEAGTGTFDRNDPNFRLFDPCKEIDPSVYKNLGWEQDDISYLYLQESKAVSCNLYGTEENAGSGVMGVANDALPYSYIEQLGLVITGLEVTLPPGFYLHGSLVPMEEYCAAAVETNSGRLNVAYAGTAFVKQPKADTCQRAIDFLSEILGTEV